MKEMIGLFSKAGFACALTLALYGCGSGSSGTPAPTPTQADQSDIVVAGSQAGVTPFIASVKLTGQSVANLSSITFSIAPRPQSVSSAVKVNWSMTALKNRGYATGPTVNLPVFGLYASYSNAVTYTLTFSDNSTQTLQSTISTSSYTDPIGIYLNPTVVKARAAGTTLGFNFFVLKSLASPPVIVDTDGALRWAAPGVTASTAAYFSNGEFVIGSEQNYDVTLLQMDGTHTALTPNLPQPLLNMFSHNLDSGPNGVLAEFSGTDALGTSYNDIVAEIAPFSDAAPYQTYDLATIISDYMTKNGDDATQFVRPGADWFHVNAATYDPNDDSVIVSSRENFLIKLDYKTHEILWILGDPTKYWYTFPSLRAKALTVPSPGLYPIGQHGVSVTSDGYVMVFNDGFNSLQEPVGEPAGENRLFSEVTTYSVNTSTMTAQVVWHFDYGKTILSQICGSSYEAAGKTYLVDFATADAYKEARLVGLDANHNVVFDFAYQSPFDCAAAWNAIEVPMEDMQISN